MRPIDVPRLLMRTPSRGRAFGPWLLLSSAVLPWMAGCGEPGLPSISAYEVKGKVMLADGKPLTSGIVFFVPKTKDAVGASGVIGSDGGFSLKTINDKVGAAPGEYAVRIESDAPPAAKKGKTAPPFPIKYTDEGSSGLVVKVEPKSNQLDPFVLK